jgi:beta-glucosidase
MLATLFSFAYPAHSNHDAIEKKVDALLAKMTLEEKVGQLAQRTGVEELTGPGSEDVETQEHLNNIKNGKVGSMLNVLSIPSIRAFQKLAVENSRLGIPMIFAYDVIHGYQTMFPVPLGESASWDLELMEATAAVAAKETAAAGIHWTFAPMVDVSLDARWGRVMEGAGEDVYLNSVIGAARTKGLQGDDLSDITTIAACAKHLAGYGFAESGRDYNTVDISMHTLHNIVLPPFKACVEAGAVSIMNSFNEIGGVPTTSSSYLQRDLLKGQWGFEGVIISDWGSIVEMIKHGFASDEKHAAQLAMQGGSDMDMEGQCYEKHLVELVQEGTIPEEAIDDAARRVLRLKFQLGLFDDPYKYCDEEREAQTLLHPDHLKLAREAGRKSIVLLKNEGQLLPIKDSISSIAIIGPLAADKDVALGSWRAQAITNSAVSVLEGIQNAVGPDVKVAHAPGCVLITSERSFHHELEINHTDHSLIPEAVELARSSDLVILAIGEDAMQSGEGRSQVDIGLPGVQQALADAIYEVNPNVVVVLMNGRPLEITSLAEKMPAILETWFLGSEAGNAIADVLFGKYNPSGKLPMSFPRHVGQCPIYYAQKSTGRPGPLDLVFWSHYTDEKNSPLYPFGYGLSYTTFEYEELKLSKSRMGMEDELEISVEVSNTGDYDGTEIVQLYIADLLGSVTRPKRELKGFEKVTLRKGETQTIRFRISKEDLAFYTRRNQWEAEYGQFRVFVGTDSNAALSAEFELVEGQDV